jgi:hypothetical protein
VGLSLGVVPDNQDYIFKLKQFLIGFATNPWTVWGSSDSVNYSGGGVDYWVDSSDLIWGSGAHSWIVLQQAGIGTNFSICFDLLYTSYQNWTLVVSPVAGFTGGSASSRPTASDEVVLVSNSYHGGQTSAFTGKLHVCQANDGSCTRWVLNRGGDCSAFGIFDKPKSPFTGWLNPSIFGFKGSISGGACSISQWNDTANLKSRVSTNFSLYMTCEGWQASIGSDLGVADEDSGDWPVMPIGLASETPGYRGHFKGSIYDLWWGPTALNTADTFPENSSRQFVVFDDLIFPWNGSTPLIA